MAVSYDPTTPLGQVRLLCSDFDLGNATFQDGDVQAFLNLNSGVVRYAAAQALDVIATNEVLVQKRIRTLDLQTDGPTEAQWLHALAQALRTQESEGLGDPTGMQDYAEMVPDAFSARLRVINQWLRQGL